MKDRVINIVVWCAGLIYVGHRSATHEGWAFAGDILLGALITGVVLDYVFVPAPRPPISVRLRSFR